MTKQKSLITSTDGRGQQILALCAAALKKARLDSDMAQAINEDGGDFQKELVRMLRRVSHGWLVGQRRMSYRIYHSDGYEERATADKRGVTLCSDLRGDGCSGVVWGRPRRGNIFMPDEWTDFGALPEDIHDVPPFPMPREFFEQSCPFFPERKIGETHFFFYGLATMQGSPLTIAKWYELLEPMSQLHLHPRFSYCTQGGAAQGYLTRQTCEARWYGILKNSPLRFKDVPFNKVKLELLSRGYEIPRAIEFVTMNILSAVQSGEYLKQDFEFLCLDRAGDGSRVFVINDSHEQHDPGILVMNGADANTEGWIFGGPAVMRKF